METNDEPTISTDEAKALSAARQFPTVAPDLIKDKIAKVDYMVHGVLTIAIVTMSNGFKVIGKAAPADPRNFNTEVGERYAFDDAFKQIWPLEGYLLCTRLTEIAACPSLPA